MFLNVIPDFAPLPSVRGLGQTQGCQEAQFDVVMQQWLSNMRGMPASDAAVGCGPSAGAPCTTPQMASQMALAIAAEYCTENADAAAFNCPTDPACSDGGVRAAGPYVAEALTYFEGFPQSVWDTEAANLQSGNFYGPQPTQRFNTPSPQEPSGSAAYQQSGGPVVFAPPAVVAPGPAPVVNNYYSTVPAAPAPAAGASTTDPLSFLTNSMIGGVPNWALIGGGLLALFLLGGKR